MENNNDVGRCAVVVLFHPEPEHIENLAVTAGQLDHLIVVDNTPDPTSLTVGAGHQVEVIRNANKGGIAGALNVGISRAHELGYRQVFLLDQDSRLPEGYISNMLAFHKRHGPAISAPVIYDVNAKATLKFTKLRRFGFKFIHSPEKYPSPLEVSWVITSGQLLELSEYLRAGPLAEELFIDGVDMEYCLRMLAGRARILVNTGIQLPHGIGHVRVTYFMRMRTVTTNHSPLRRYYMARNDILMCRKYALRFPALVACMLYRYANELFAILFLEEGRKRRLVAMLNGIWDGLHGRSGPAARAW